MYEEPMDPTAEPPTPADTGPFLPPELIPNVEDLVLDDEGPIPKLDPEVIPNIENLVIQDDQPLDNIFVERQQKLLTEPLYGGWSGPEDGVSFLALANVGLFPTPKRPPLVPDVMLSLDVEAGDQSCKQHRSYLMWIMGKAPEVVIEIVSDRTGGEDTTKIRAYARVAVTYYVIFDPEEHLKAGVLRVFVLNQGKYDPIAPDWLPAVGLGLKLWEGTYQGVTGHWLRWCDRQGQFIPTNEERAEQERLAKEQAQQRAEQERLGKEQAREQAKQARQQADEAKRQLEQDRQRYEHLLAHLRAHGIEPPP
jgi:Uma2 family endonuclease